MEMYAETGVNLPYFQSVSPDVQQFDDLCFSDTSNSYLGSVVQSSVTSDFDFGGECDLFKSPEAIIEQQLVTDIESLQNEEFLSDVFHDYEEIETSPLSEILNYKPPVKTDEIPIVKQNVHQQILKSVRSDSHEAQMKHDLDNGNGSHTQPQLLSEHTMEMEDRSQKLSRYRNKKAKRNFGRKIKYACRKALADNQPRIRGRFAKTE